MSLFITPGEPGWEESLSYECEQSRFILLKKPAINPDEWMAKAEAILKERSFKRQTHPNEVGSNFISYMKTGAK